MTFKSSVNYEIARNTTQQVEVKTWQYGLLILDWSVPLHPLKLWRRHYSRWSRTAQSLFVLPWTDGSLTPRKSDRNPPDPGEEEVRLEETRNCVRCYLSQSHHLDSSYKWTIVLIVLPCSKPAVSRSVWTRRGWREASWSALFQTLRRERRGSPRHPPTPGRPPGSCTPEPEPGRWTEKWRYRQGLQVWPFM